MVLVLAAVAVLGYAAGHRHAPAAHPVAHRETTRSASGANILLEYPSGWRPVATAPAIPGLSLAHPLALAPGGDAGSAGLLSGELPASEPSPLPARLLALLHGIPKTEVVNLIDGQAFRYPHLSLPGYAGRLDLYVMPYAGKGPTALACYAAQGFIRYLSECEQIVAGLTPVGQSSTYDLTPDTGYALRLGALIEGLNTERLALRRAMRTNASPAAAGRLATTLAGRFAAAAGSLAVLEPPPVVGPAQATLESAMLQAKATYTALAAASTAKDRAAYDAALRQVDAAEAGVDTALEGFALLGYSQS